MADWNTIRRFDFNVRKFHLDLNDDAREAWVSVAWSIFHALGISSEGNLGVFNLVVPEGWCDVNLSGSSDSAELQQRQPIYFFFYPPPPKSLADAGWNSSFHYWSFYKSGQPPLSPDDCHTLGLPVELWFKKYFKSWSWPTNHYKLLRQYLVPRGFDPTTTDFARHLEYDGYTFRPINNSDRFKVVDEGCPTDTDIDSNHSLQNQQHENDRASTTHCSMNMPVSGDALVNSEADLTTPGFVANKRQRTSAGERGIEYHCHEEEERDLCHKNHTSNARTTDEPSLRLIHPLPKRQMFATDTSMPQNVNRFQGLYNGHVPPYAHPNRTSASTLFNLDSMNRPTNGSVPRTTNTGPIEVEPQHEIMLDSSSPIAFQGNLHGNAGAADFNIVPNPRPLASPIDSAYADPTVYSIETTTSDESYSRTVESTGTQTSMHHVPAAATMMFSGLPNYHSPSYSTPTIDNSANPTMNHTGILMTDGYDPSARYHGGGPVKNTTLERYKNIIHQSYSQPPSHYPHIANNFSGTSQHHAPSYTPAVPTNPNMYPGTSDGYSSFPPDYGGGQVGSTWSAAPQFYQQPSTSQYLHTSSDMIREVQTSFSSLSRWNQESGDNVHGPRG
ncbi:hypothetical protein PM082_023705 [Marasmius tenuissimus]|nr:hypothetical protein PM082_023705 [Marasmius tenuissimus]